MNKHIIKGGRIVSIIISAIMIHYFLTRDVFRADNPFIVPDVTFAILILVSAFLPNRLATTAMLFSFSMAAGVIMVSFFNHLVEGRFDVGNLILFIVFVVTAASLGWGNTRRKEH